ncbi:hypothetical protein BSY19_5074 (plasmid) [Bosea sp. RAC05]|nr:hypothetical protein BSY19_5074 [Bosea sp. RAC05]
MTSVRTMFHQLSVAILLASSACAVQAQELDGVTGAAKSAITRYVQGTRIPCYKMTGETTCLLKETASDAKVFYGTLKNDPAPIAVAFIGYQYDATGNAMDQMAVVFKEVGGRWTAIGRADNTIGTNPRALEFGSGEISYTGTVVGPRDNRANPRGSARFKLVVSERAVTFVK